MAIWDVERLLQKMNQVKQREWLRGIVLFILFFAIPFITFFELTNSGNLLVSGDGAGFFSIKKALLDYISTGEFPLWTPYLQNGAPLALDQSYGLFYPITYLLGWMPIQWFALSYYSLHMAIAGISMYYFMQEQKVQKNISFVVALLFSMAICMGGFRKNHMMIISVIVWIPTIFLFVKRYINGKEVKYLVIASIFMAIQFLGGFVQCALYTDLVVGFYLLAYMRKEKLSLKKILKDGCIWGFSYIGLITFALLPMLKIMGFYESLGAAPTTFDTFASYSIAFRKLLMMLFPLSYGADVWMYGGPLVSSEIDIEIFLGTAVIFLVLVGVICCFHQFVVKLLTALSVGCFIYAANAHVPFLNKLLYKIPLISSFRVPSRILFLFVFFMFVLLGITLNAIVTRNEMPKLTRVSLCVSMGIVAVACIFITLIKNLGIAENLKDFHAQTNVFIVPIFVVLVCCFCVFLLQKKDQQWVQNLLLVTVVATVLLQTFPYYKMVSDSPSGDYSLSDETEQIREVLGDGNLFYGTARQTAYFESINGFNKSLVHQLPTLDCYMSMNNPNIYKLMNNGKYAPLNFSGLYTYFSNSKYNIACQNDVLSMMNITVIPDREGNVPENGSIYQAGDVVQELYANEAIEIPNTQGELYVLSTEVAIKPNTYYKLSLQSVDNGVIDDMYFDLFGEGYDDAMQDVAMPMQEQVETYEFTVFSGDVPSDTPIYFRMICTPEKNILFRNLVLSELETEMTPNVYEKLYEENGYTYYKNTRANSELYFAESVDSYADLDLLYANDGNIDFSKVAYIKDFERAAPLKVGEISEVVRKNAAISATVQNKADGFVCFSENFFPGWTAFVDGEKTEIYQVNGIIQGAFVPVGTHTVEFRFVATDFYVGLAFSALLLFTLIILIHKTRKREKADV